MIRSLFFLLIPVIIACNSNKYSEKLVSHEGVKFSFPCTVKDISESINLNFFSYRGFRAKFEFGEVVIQLKDMPIWIGDKNSTNDIYLDNKVSGVTFDYMHGNNDYMQLRSVLSKKYSNEFTQLDSSISFIQLDKQYFLATEHKKGRFYVSYLYGIDKDQISNYINNVW